MDALTSIEELPLEVLECIVRYLTDEDLSRCCTICKSWREVFSDDMFWKKHCNIKLSVYLDSASCLVEPYFTVPHIESSSLTPVNGWRLCFLREKHALNNLRSGRFERKEIEFDCDDSISYNIKVEFVANDYVFLHTTFETAVWNVAQEPKLEMNIPFQLVELWEKNLYKFHENNLIVVQCNVVQIFKICLISKTWLFHHTFFFDKPEEFSLNIAKDTNVNILFKNTSYDIGETVERVICGKFLIGIVTTKTSLQNPVMHIWDLKSSKKVKEENCSEYFGSGVKNIFLDASPMSEDKIIVTCQKYQKVCFAVYNLAVLKFIALYQCHNGEALLCDRYMCIYDHSKEEILKYDFDTNVAEKVFKLDEGRLRCHGWHFICDKIVVVSSGNLIGVDLLSKEIKVQPCDSSLKTVEIVMDKYIVLHDSSDNMKELFAPRATDSFIRNKQTAFVKLFSLPPGSGVYRSTNEFCTKMVLERANKLIVLNFW